MYLTTQRIMITDSMVIFLWLPLEQSVVCQFTSFLTSNVHHPQSSLQCIVSQCHCVRTVQDEGPIQGQSQDTWPLPGSITSWTSLDNPTEPGLSAGQIQTGHIPASTRTSSTRIILWINSNWTHSSAQHSKQDDCTKTPRETVEML